MLFRWEANTLQFRSGNARLMNFWINSYSEDSQSLDAMAWRGSQKENVSMLRIYIKVFQSG